MNRRKYILSTLGIGAGIGLASKYNTQPSIASNIDLEDRISLPSEIENEKTLTVKITITELELTPERIGNHVDLNNIDIRGKTNTTSFMDTTSVPIKENITLSNEETTTDILSEDSPVIPIDVKFNTSSFELIIEIIIDSDAKIFTLNETIPISEQNISSPNDSEPENIEQVHEDLEGEGTLESPYVITNDHELQSMNVEPSAHYALSINIDASGTDEWYGGNGFEPIGLDTDFSGSLNGNGFVIENLYINRPETDEIGLFSKIDVSSDSEDIIEIKNVGLVSCEITGKSIVGGLCGYIQNSNIKFSYSTGNIIGLENNVGGLVGVVSSNLGPDSMVKDSYSHCSVTGEDTVGGIIGDFNAGSEARRCYSTGEVKGESSVGGLLGSHSSHNTTTTNLYWDKQSSGKETTAQDRGEPLKTDEMQGDNAEENMEGFDFEDIWTTVENDYPKLQWQIE